MRKSIASLATVVFVFGSLICNASISRKTKLIGFALIALSMPSALLEFTRNISHPRYNLSDCTLTEALNALAPRGFRQITSWKAATFPRG
jgi:hypothetical protein